MLIEQFLSNLYLFVGWQPYDWMRLAVGASLLDALLTAIDVTEQEPT